MEKYFNVYLKKASSRNMKETWTLSLETGNAVYLSSMLLLHIILFKDFQMKMKSNLK